MAYRIADRKIETHLPASAEDLRKAFETLMCELHQADLGARKKMRYRTPIVQRAKRFGISQADAEKRTVADAARVLAQLWKV